jgi:hypothetical protein
LPAAAGLTIVVSSVAIALGRWETWAAPLLVGLCLAGLAVLAIAAIEPASSRAHGLLLFAASWAMRLTASGLYAAWLGPRGWLDDAIAYDRVGWALAEAWRTGAAVQNLGGLEWVAAEPFARVVAAVYWVVGHSPISIIVLNAFLGSASVYFAYRLGCELLGEDVGRLAGWMCAIYTGFWVYSLMPLKDGLIMASVLLFFYSLLRLMDGKPAASRIIPWAAAALTSGSVVLLMRDYVFIAASLGGLAFILVRAAHARGSRWLVAVGLVALGVAVFPVARRLAGYSIPLGNFGAGSFLSGVFDAIPPSETLAGLLRWTLGHPLLSTAYISVSVIATLLAPYAWIIPGSIPSTASFDAYTVAFPGMWLWYLVLPFAVLGLWSSLRRSRGNVVGLLVFAAVLLMLFSLTIPRESRHRDLVMPVLLLLASAGIVFNWRLKRLAWFAWVPLLLAAVVKLDAWVPLIASAASAAVLAALIRVSEWRRHRNVGAPVHTDP